MATNPVVRESVLTTLRVPADFEARPAITRAVIPVTRRAVAARAKITMDSPTVDAGFWEKKADDGTGGIDSSADGKAIGTELAQMISGRSLLPCSRRKWLTRLLTGISTASTRRWRSHQAAMKQSVGVFAKLLEAVTGRMQAGFRFADPEGPRRDKQNEALESHFPAAKDPAVRPIDSASLRSVHDQHEGQRRESGEQTKAMLKAFGTKTGLTTPPADPDGSSDNSRSLVEELLARGWLTRQGSRMK